MLKKRVDIQERRDKAIDNALRYYGLSVIIRTEDQFNVIKRFLGEDVLYLDFVPQMISRPTPTGIVIWSEDNLNTLDFDTGSVGCAEYQKKHFFRLVEFDDFFKL